jgi:uncharacterized iron-regulated protein
VALPRRRCLLGAAGGALLLSACAAGVAPPRALAVQDARAVLAGSAPIAGWLAQALQALGQPEWLILGEQHDADAHQQLHAAVVQHLAARAQLAAVVLEMAEQGRDTTALPRSASEAEVQTRLGWVDAHWPWARYGPAVMAAVRAGVVVHGGNLPRARHREVSSDPAWEGLLPEAQWQALRALIDSSHCGLLPATQWTPMARIQIARDDAMAATLVRLRAPGRTVLLITGAQHARRTQGVPVHLSRRTALAPQDPRLRVVELRATDAARTDIGDPAPEADAIWLTPAVPPRDHCAGLRARGAAAARSPRPALA